MVLAGAAWSLRSHRHLLARPGPALAFFLVCCIVGAGAFNHAWGLPHARLDSPQRFLEAIAREYGDREICLYRPSETFRGAMVYYLERRIPVAQKSEDSIRWSGDKPRALFIAEGKAIDELIAAFKPRAVETVLQAQFGDHRAALLSFASSGG